MIILRMSNFMILKNLHLKIKKKQNLKEFLNLINLMKIFVNLIMILTVMMMKKMMIKMKLIKVINNKKNLI